MHRFPYTDESERLVLSRDLILGSLEHAAAATSLVHHHGSTYVVAVHALARPQLEFFFRGVFFGTPSETSDEEVQAFIKDDRLPRRADPGRGNRKFDIGFAKMRDVAEAQCRLVVDQLPGLGIPIAFPMNKDQLNAFVHGGGHAARTYRLNASGQHNVASERLIEDQIRRAASFAVIGMTFVMGRLATVDALPGRLGSAAQRFFELMPVSG